MTKIYKELLLFLEIKYDTSFAFVVPTIGVKSMWEGNVSENPSS